jgi:hypothetical protein
MVFFSNGIIIQDIDREYRNFTDQGSFPDEEFKNYRAYQGLGRYYRSWPLSLENDILSKQLTAEVQKWFVIDYTQETPEADYEIVPERQLGLQYIQHCRSKGIRIRVLFCRTESEKPFWDSPLPNLGLLGYDYCTGIPYYSSIPDDLLDTAVEYMDHPVYKAMKQCVEKLNRYKLFDNEKDIRTYIEKRNQVLGSEIASSQVIIGGQEFTSELVDRGLDIRIIQLAEVVGDL